jgi:uncharacterized MAPEG superfamily protein
LILAKVIFLPTPFQARIRCLARGLVARTGLGLALAFATAAASAQLVSALPTQWAAEAGLPMAIAVTLGVGSAGGYSPEPTQALLCAGPPRGGSVGVNLGAVVACPAGTQAATVAVRSATGQGAKQGLTTAISAAQLDAVALQAAKLGQRSAHLILTYTGTRAQANWRTLILAISLPLGNRGVTAVLSPVLPVSGNGTSMLTLRYALAGSDSALGGWFCSRLAFEVGASGVASDNPCAADSLLGSAGPSNFAASAAGASETLTVPTGVAQLAQLQAMRPAAVGANGTAVAPSSLLYFVRQFSSGVYALQRLRLAGRSADAALAVTRVELAFRADGGRQTHALVQRDGAVPPLSAWVDTQGVGTLRGRWEVAVPGDAEPTALDLSSEAGQSPIERIRQQRWQQVGRFDVAVGAAGRVLIPGPAALPSAFEGRYLVLLRLEASIDPVSGASVGGASFALPVLRYDVSGIAGGPLAAPSPRNAAPADAAGGMPNDEVGQVLLAWPEGLASPPRPADLARELGGVVRSQAGLPSFGARVALLQFANAAAADAAVAAITRRVAGVIVDRHARAYLTQAGSAVAVPLASAPAASPTAIQSYAPTMVFGDAQPAPLAARVGIIDTSLQPETQRAWLQASAVEEKRFIGPFDDAAPPEHGSAVAAVISGRAAGAASASSGFRSLAPGVALFQAAVMRTEKGQATTNTLALILALDWLASRQVEVINMSLASAGDRVLAWVVGKVIAKGIVIVAAVGHGPTAPALRYPAAYPGVVAVGVVDAARTPFARAARGDYVALSAPGVDVWLPVGRDGGDGAYYTGSSFAAPWVSAAIARMTPTQRAAKPIERLCAMAWPFAPPAPEGMGCGVLRWIAPPP